jgi:acetyl esterase/lipase
MSLRLDLLNRLMRHFARPSIGRARDPAAERARFERFARVFPRPPHLLFRDGPVARIACRPRRLAPVLLYFHGGAYITGSPATHQALLGRLARLTGMEIHAPHYPLAPEHPAPAAFDAACAAHAALRRLYPADQILLGGDSAGGGLALALLAHLCQTGERPLGLIAFSPWTDLALTGESLVSNATAEVILPPERVAEAARLVCGPLDPKDPRISPLYAEFPDPPPVLIQVGTGEVLRDDARRMAAKVNATLSEWQHCPHGWQMFAGYLPEAGAALREAARFCRHLAEAGAR